MEDKMVLARMMIKVRNEGVKINGFKIIN